jgi:hypothetical protein
MFVKQAATRGMNVAKEYCNCKSRLNLPHVCIVFIVDLKMTSWSLTQSVQVKAKVFIHPQYQSCVESGKRRIAYGKSAFDEGTGDSGCVSSSLGDHDRWLEMNVTAIPITAKKKKTMMMTMTMTMGIA